MRMKGKRLKRTRLIKKGRYIVEVEVEVVIPSADPRQPCYESETIELLRQVEARAEKGDMKWLRRVGKVYELVGP